MALTEKEKEIMQKVSKRNGNGKMRTNGFSTFYGMQGNFVVCVLQSKRGIIGIGVAKRNTIDNFSWIIGSNIAFARAVKFYIQTPDMTSLKMQSVK